jgi:hypothetical protein
MPRAFVRTCKGFMTDMRSTSVNDAFEDFWSPYDIQIGVEDLVELPKNFFFGSARVLESDRQNEDTTASSDAHAFDGSPATSDDSSL